MEITQELLEKNGFTRLGGFMGVLYRLNADYENTYLRDYGKGLYCFVSRSGRNARLIHDVQKEIETMEELQACLDFLGFQIKIEYEKGK